MKKDIRNFVGSYDAYQHNKIQNQSINGLLQSLSSPDQRWKKITLDLITRLYLILHQHIIIVIFFDHLIKLLFFAHMIDTVIYLDLAYLYINTIFKHRDLYRILVFDTDSCFINNFWKTLFIILNIKFIMIKWNVSTEE